MSFSFAFFQLETKDDLFSGWTCKLVPTFHTSDSLFADNKSENKKNVMDSRLLNEGQLSSQPPSSTVVFVSAQGKVRLYDTVFFVIATFSVFGQKAQVGFTLDI